MQRRIYTLGARFFALTLILSALAIADFKGLPFISEAEAQSWRQRDPSAVVLPGSSNRPQRRSNSSLFRIFRFDRPRQQRREPARQGASRSSSGAPAAGRVQRRSAPVVVAPPPKDADARQVVVFGDEFADQMHEGMIDRLDGERKLESVSVSIPGSGLANTTRLDWNVEGPQRLQNYDDIAVVVVALGYSDARGLLDGEITHPFGGPEWRRLYRNRVSTLALRLLAEGDPVIFVGLPPMGDPIRDEQVRIVNQALEEGLAPTRARFVRVYEAFSDENGNYVRAGPNLAGEIVNLRTRDGIFFNRAGREKYAQFVERFIRREGQGAPEPQVSTVIFEGSSRSGTGIGPVITLTSGFADPTAVLLGDSSQIAPDSETVSARLATGAAIEVPQGRADFFVTNSSATTTQ
ncbi:MAG: hypothetical protein AAGH60_02575 [Pseudomonadota bacterium]